MKQMHSPRVAGALLLAMAAFGGGPLWAADAPSDAANAAWRQLSEPLARYGIQPTLTYIGDALADVSGGVRRGAVYQGHLELAVDADLQRLFGWSGAKFHANAFNTHGDGLSREYVGNLMTVSTIEALNHTRLYEIWVEQSFTQNFSLRLGQLGADTEFNTSSYADLFLNSTFGWPAIAGSDLPAGGPAAPLSAMGLRAKASPSDQLTLLLGMFDGNAAGPGAGDPQNLDPHGLNFRVNDSPLLMAELQYAYKLDPSRPGTVKLGAWVHTGNFSDQRFDTNGVLLADPTSNGMPAQHRGVIGPYAELEQMLVPFDGKGETGIAAYGRLSGSQSDRNLIAFYADGGVKVSGFWAARPNDSFAFGFGYAGISSSARDFDQDTLNFGTATARRDYEAVLEATYVARVAPGWTVQPDIQYIFHPGGGASDPASASGARIANALVLGMRTTLQWGASGK